MGRDSFEHQRHQALSESYVAYVIITARGSRGDKNQVKSYSMRGLGTSRDTYLLGRAVPVVGG